MKTVLAATIAIMSCNSCAAASCGMSLPAFQRPWALHLALEGVTSPSTQDRDPILGAIADVISHHPNQAIRSLGALSSRRLDDETSAEIAYWASRAYNELGQTDRAKRLLDLSQTWHNTFYGQLSGATPRYDVSRYPATYFRYIDPRTDYALIWSVIRQESRFHVAAKSGAGAEGLMQVIPSTASAVTNAFGARTLGQKMREDPHYAVAIGSTWLGYLYKKYDHNIPLTLAAYNAGELCADTWARQIGDPRDSHTDGLLWIEAVPYDETRNYIKAVIANYMVYRSVNGPSLPSENHPRENPPTPTPGP